MVRIVITSTMRAYVVCGKMELRHRIRLRCASLMSAFFLFLLRRQFVLTTIISVGTCIMIASPKCDNQVFYLVKLEPQVSIQFSPSGLMCFVLYYSVSSELRFTYIKIDFYSRFWSNLIRISHLFVWCA